MSLSLQSVRSTLRGSTDHRGLLSVIQDLALVFLATAFLYAHASRLLDGSVASAGFAVEQALLLWMFLTRRRPTSTSTNVLDWVVAAGGWLPLLARPEPTGGMLEPTGIALQLVGLTGTCYAFLHLGRSFGVVAAYRGLQVGGPYRFVRHPIYLSHLVTTTGFLIANVTLANVLVVLGFLVATVMRINAEERHLRAACDYDDYSSSVRWRLIPGLF